MSRLYIIKGDAKVSLTGVARVFSTEGDMLLDIDLSEMPALEAPFEHGVMLESDQTEITLTLRIPIEIVNRADMN